MTKIVCTSDLHGYLPDIPECDILVIAGDVCPTCDHTIEFQQSWLDTNFHKWMIESKAKNVVFIAGNHDFYFEKYVTHRWTNGGYCNCFYLQDSSVEIQGLKIYGTPWQRRFFDWAFNLDEPDLDNVFDKIPFCDILITHQPAWMCGDWAQYGQENVGSKRLLDILHNSRQPKLHVTGHIHSGAGLYRAGKTISINASYVNEKYQPVNQLWQIEI